MQTEPGRALFLTLFATVTAAMLAWAALSCSAKRTRVAEDEMNELHENIQLLFAEQDDEGNTQFITSPVYRFGGISDEWPTGFIDEGAQSAAQLLKAGLEKHKAELEESSDE